MANISYSAPSRLDTLVIILETYRASVQQCTVERILNGETPKGQLRAKGNI